MAGTRPPTGKALCHNTAGEKARVPKLKFASDPQHVSKQFGRQEATANFDGVSGTESRWRRDLHVDGVEALNSLHAHRNATVKLITEREPMPAAFTVLAKMERKSCAELRRPKRQH